VPLQHGTMRSSCLSRHIGASFVLGSVWVAACGGGSSGAPANGAQPDGGLEGGAPGPSTDASTDALVGDEGDAAAPTGNDAAMDTGATPATDAGGEAGDAGLTRVNLWTWMSGSNATGATVVPGTAGTAASANTPGARYGTASWSDAAGHFWLFGGAPTGGSTKTNDLWRFDGADWTWITGSSATGASGVYGTLGSPAMTNTPGARVFASSWKDTSGVFWMFGGNGYAAGSSQGPLDDLWKFDGTAWTWVAGASTAGAASTYGTKGTAASSNDPGARQRAVSWFARGAAWVFGGLDGAGHPRSDLWKFDGTNWTWIAGSSSTNATGVYGSLGVAAATSGPGARQDAVGWTDASGQLWLYGGWGYDSAGTQSDLGDLWKFDGTNWTWVKGSSTGNGAATYGALGVTSGTNDPGGRENAITWVDGHGTPWMMSGTSGHDVGELNDLWKFDGSAWTWISGASTAGANGTYGSLGVAGASSTPGGRDSATAWTGADGDLWLFGGWGFGATGSDSDLSDLWRYQP
jgi:hypothetical protein